MGFCFSDGGVGASFLSGGGVHQFWWRGGGSSKKIVRWGGGGGLPPLCETLHFETSSRINPSMILF